MKKIVLIIAAVFVTSQVMAAQTVTFVNMSGVDMEKVQISPSKEEKYIDVPLTSKVFEDESEITVTLPTDKCIWDIRMISEGIPTNWHDYDSCKNKGKKLLLNTRTIGGSAWFDYE